jgi:hypothetical protein
VANTKEVTIVADAPFDWTRQLTDEEAKTFAVWTLGPHALDVTHHSAVGINLPTGGYVTRYRVQITGVEAMSSHALVTMRHAFDRMEHAEVHVAQYVDMDDGFTPYDILTPEEQEASNQRAKQWAKELFANTRIVTRDCGNGISESRFIPHGEPCPEGFVEGAA